MKKEEQEKIEVEEGLGAYVVFGDEQTALAA